MYYYILVGTEIVNGSFQNILIQTTFSCPTHRRPGDNQFYDLMRALYYARVTQTCFHSWYSPDSFLRNQSLTEIERTLNRREDVLEMFLPRKVDCQLIANCRAVFDNHAAITSLFGYW